MDRRYVDYRIRVVFPTLDRVEDAPRAVIKRGERVMDSCAVDLFPGTDGDPLWATQLVSGTPVHVTWEANGTYSDFYGYIHTTERTKERNLRVYGIGLGMPLLNKGAQAYASTNINTVIGQICARRNLNYITDANTVAQINLAQNGVTDWDWLLALSAKGARALHFRGATVNLLPLDQVRDWSMSSAIDIVLPEGGAYVTEPRSLYSVRSFNTTTSQIAEYQTFGRPVRTVLAQGQIAQVVSQFGDGELQPSTDAVMSPLDALTKSGELYYKKRWRTRAELKMDGIPYVYPLDLIRSAPIAGASPTAVWSVLDVTHRLGGHDYVMECTLGREPDTALSRAPWEVNLYAQSADYGSAGADRWYSDPLLRPAADIAPGTALDEAVLDHRWTAPYVKVR